MRKKVFFVIPTLAGGGAERVFVNLVKNIDKTIFDVTLVYLSDNNVAFELPKDISVVNLKVGRVRKAPLKLLKVIKENKPDLIVSTLGHLNEMLLLLKPFFPSNTKIIVRQTSIYSLQVSSKTLRKLTSHLYRKADKVICQSELMKKDFIEHTQTNKDKVVKLFNPIDTTQVLFESREKVNFTFKQDYKYIIFIGRLSEVKRVPDILDAFEKYNKINNKSKLLILGIGPKEEEIKRIIKQKGLNKSVILLGFQKNPYKWLKQSNLFLLASKNEGMPNVLIEALALNVPVLVKKHPGGTIDIMEAVNIEDRFVEELIIQKKSFNTYQCDMLAEIKKKFGVRSITKKYEETFISVLKER